MNEFELIGQITAGLPSSQAVKLGPGDDAAVVRLSGDLVVSTDMMVQDVDFKLNWSSAKDIGRKIAAVNISDVEAMGATPIALVVALALSPETDDAWAEECAAGIREECDKAGVALVGGDLSSGAVVAATGTSLGQVEHPVTRAGAQPSDVLAYCGKLGWASAGLMALQRGFSSPLAAVSEQRTPTVPYGQGRVAAAAGATAMIDVSDGLLADVGHIAEASQVHIDVEKDRLEVPDVVQRVASATGKEPWQFILAGGEDHALVATFPAEAELPEGWIRIGSVSDGAGVTVDGEPYEGPAGWQHFS